MERAFVLLFLVFVAACSVVGLVAPQRLLKPKGDWWFFDWMTGRILYSSITRVRVTCSLLLLVVLFVVVGMVLWPPPRP